MTVMGMLAAAQRWAAQLCIGAAAAIAAAPGAPAPACAGELSPLTYEGMMLDLPSEAAGWKRTIVSDGIVLQLMLPPDPATGGKPHGGAIIQIPKPDASGSSFETAFHKFARSKIIRRHHQRPSGQDRELLLPQQVRHQNAGFRGRH
jgi:hypothetical protein